MIQHEDEDGNKLSTAEDLMDDYFEEENADITKLYADLQQEMFAESFLKSLFQQEKAEQKEKEEGDLYG